MTQSLTTIQGRAVLLSVHFYFWVKFFGDEPNVELICQSTTLGRPLTDFFKFFISWVFIAVQSFL